MKRVILLSLMILGFVVVGLGCSGGNAAVPARVSGSISYKGQPIKAGAMAFHTPEGTIYGASISQDGTYSATDLPVGELVVTVETETINPNKGGGALTEEAKKRMEAQGQRQPPPGMPGAVNPSEFYVKIPAKYSKPKTSPISVTLAAGRQVKNIELTD
jgi:hypothetical protein